MDLCERVRECVDLLYESAQRESCPIEVDARTPVHGFWDSARIDQIVTNLLTNAIKYGAHKRVRVKVQQSGDEAELIVRDEGIGIHQADQARIFERFERAASPRNFPGIGLGLWIVQTLVAAHSGDITLHSEPGRGATFVVTLPRGLQPVAPGPRWIQTAPQMHH